MSRLLLRRSLTILVVVALAGASASLAGAAQAPAKPATQKPPAARPAAPAPPPVIKPAEPAAPPRAAVQDLRFRTVYATGDQRTESVSYQKGSRERFEFADMVLLKQHDLKRTVQISRAANTYLLVPDGASGPSAPPAAGAPQPGIVMVTTTLVDTGERKTAFGLQARRVRSTIDRQPMAGACDPSKQRIETDAWYVDLPTPAQTVADAPVHSAGACVDQVKATQSGDPKLLGFPIAYSTTVTGDDGKPYVVTMEITELEVTTLDVALFEIPPGMREAGDVRALSQALSDANEAKLAEEVAATAPAAAKPAGVIRIAVPELLNKTGQQIDTRSLRALLVAELAEAGIEAEPLPAGSQADLLQQASARADDYLVIAEVTELKVSKGGGFGGILKAASSVAGGGPSKDPTEAAVSIRLVQPDGKARFSTTAKAKDGGFDMKTGLGVARFAGSMYLNVMTGRMMMGALNGGMAGNLQGLGMLGNPALFNMQAQGMGSIMGVAPGGMRMGMDPTAGAASFLMNQAMAGQAPEGAPGQPAVSFDAALAEALKNGAKAVAENLKKGRN